MIKSLVRVVGIGSGGRCGAGGGGVGEYGGSAEWG